jgi:Na+-translocating ferredoxin:NAD+ oxidoreductase RnfC subunit
MSNLAERYNIEREKVCHQLSGPKAYFVSRYIQIEDEEAEIYVIITRKDDWLERQCLTDKSDQEDIIDIIHELGLESVGDAHYEMTGDIYDISVMIDELVRRGFETNQALDEFMDTRN